ncbi:hypothetical protein BO71DRAFT_309149, partial [Aspergillus ellipticus CBS 707.79]
MRLRERIRLPERFNQEQFLSPCSQRPLRETKTPGPANYVDFNPDLPPAAFPTLNDARPPPKDNGDTQDHEGENHQRIGDQELPREETDCVVEIRRDDCGHTDLANMSPEEIECMMASNGEHNPIYMRNMAIMAAAEDDDTLSIFRDREYSDVDEAMADSTNEEHAEWRDFSSQMQVEIFDNMLQSYNWATVCHLLQLTTEEGEEIRQMIRQRDEKIGQEDLQLEAMRAKQLRALLRIDNTVKGHNEVPHRGIFSRISRQYSGKLQDTLGPDFQLCQTSEVLEARKFLHDRGANPMFAGKWSHGLSPLQDS